MTRLFKEDETCSVCGHVSKQTGIMSTNVLCAPDIDNRPGEMMRSTMPYWVHRCPSCGYCAPSLSKSGSQINQVIQSEPYQQQLTHESYPELANSFLCCSMILEHLGDYPYAGWHALHAAWACDDVSASESAVSCRQKALQYFQEARAMHVAFAKDVGIEEVTIADLLRRIGQFDQAEAISLEGLMKNPDKLVKEMLDAQIFFAQQQDLQGYNLDQAKEIVGKDVG